ncbi:MAG: Ig-like domain repeat protein, partial [Clostridia bacterium]|nr:Ig-like domain repeat protein [Clostridia bacterium]
MRNVRKWPLSFVIIAIILCSVVLMPQTAYAWKTKTHGYSANLLLSEARSGYVTVDGNQYAIPKEFKDALANYPSAFRAGVLGPDFYPDMLTGQSYIHPYDAKAGVGVGDWLMELVNAVNAMPKNSDARMEAMAFTLGMAVHFAGDQFGHDFINAFAGGAYPAYADVIGDDNKLYYIIRHMAQETYMDSLIGDRLGSTGVAAPENFILNTWIYDGNANNGPAKIYSKYDGGMMYQYKYLVDLRTTIYKWAEKNRTAVVPPVPQMVQYCDRWVEDLDTATYQLIVAFDDIAHDFLTGANGKDDIAIVTDRLNTWLEKYGKYASPTPDALVNMSKAITRSQEWILEQLGLSSITEKWKEFKNTLISNMVLWGLAQAGVDINKYKESMKNPERALKENGGSQADYDEFKTYMDAFDNDPESFDAFYNTLVMGRLILMGPDNLNTFFSNYGVTSSYKNAACDVMMDEIYIEIHTKDGKKGIDFYGTDDDVYIDVYEGSKLLKTKLLDTSGWNDFEMRGDKTDDFYVELPREISPAKLKVALRTQKSYDLEIDEDDWTTDAIWITCRRAGATVVSRQKVLNRGLKFNKWGEQKYLDFSTSGISLTYPSALNPEIISYMWSNDNSTQWVNSKNLLWNNKTARRKVLYEVFHGFKPTIELSVDQDTFQQGTNATLTADFTSYWNGITKERRDKEYIISSVNETKQQACSGTVQILVITDAGTGRLTGTVSDGRMAVDLSSLAPGKYKFRVDYDGDDYNGSAQSNEVTVTVTAPIPSYTVTYKVVNGTWSDGTTADKSETVRSGSSPANVPANMKPATGFTGGSWDKNPAGATITGNTTFTYTFVAIPTYTVTYKVVNGTWSDNTTADKSETVMSGSSPANVPANMKPDT